MAELWSGSRLRNLRTGPTKKLMKLNKENCKVLRPGEWCKPGCDCPTALTISSDELVHSKHH